jgi:Domain of unknown function (DUF4190)
MSEISWERTTEARSALTAIVSDPEHGAAALSNPRTMSNLLKDLLPDAPREKTVLVAAAEAGLANTLRDHVAQGVDSATAVRLTASQFSANTSFTPEACDWVAGEFAIALGISDSAPGPVSSPPGPVQPPPGAVYSPYAPTQFAPGPAQYQPGPVVSQPGPPQFQPGPGQYSPGQAQFPPPGQAQFPPPGQAQFPPSGPPLFQPGPVQYAPGQVQYPPPPGQYAPGFGQPQPAGQWQVTGQLRRNNLALASLICGLSQILLWILVLPEIMAIIFGLVAIRQIKRTGESGRGMAVAGVVLGVLGLFGFIVLVIIGATAKTNTG